MQRDEREAKAYLAKRIRARGGCLGGMRRRRTRETAKIHGEPSPGLDPWVSEWGNPPPAMGRRPRGEHMAARGRHRGK